MTNSFKIRKIHFFHDPDLTGTDYVTHNDDEEVYVSLADGRTFYAWFFTPAKIEEIMFRHTQTGESLDGSYFWACNFIIVSQISKAHLSQVLKEIIEVQGNLDPFDEIDPD